MLLSLQRALGSHRVCNPVTRSIMGFITFILPWSVGSMVTSIQILQTCNVVAVLKQRLASFQHLRSSSLQAPSGNGGLHLGLVLVSTCQCASFAVLFPIDPSKNRRTATLYFNLPLSSQIFGTKISGMVEFDLLSPLCKLRFFNIQYSQALKG